MSADAYVYSESNSEEMTSIFDRKDWLQILDNQNGNYASNQSVIDTSQLSNSEKYMSYSQAYITLPMTMTMTGISMANPATAATSADYTLGLKNWFGQMIHSMAVECGGTTVVQTTPYINIINAFKLMTTFSFNDVKTIGASIGFYPDNALSIAFVDASNATGHGTCNNQNYLAPPVVTGANNSYDVGNEGFLRRQQYINYDPDGLTAPTCGAFSSLLTANTCNAIYKSYISQKTNGATAGTDPGVIQYSINGIIRLKDLHSFFANLPLVRGLYLRITLNLNQCRIEAKCSDTANRLLSIVSVTASQNGTVPLMLASGFANNGSASSLLATNAGTLYASLFVGNRCQWSQQVSQGASATSNASPNILLYVPSYVFNPVMEQAYTNSRIKKMVYTDYFQKTIESVSAGSSFNTLLTNGQAGLKSVTVIPYFTKTANAGQMPIQSIFDTASSTTSPLCILGQFNVVVSGQNMLYTNARYSYELFLNQFYGVNAVNAGMSDGVNSGLISQLDWETAYCFHYVNCSRMPPSERAVPKSVSVIGQNLSAKDVDLFCFIEYAREIGIDIVTGQLVTNV